MESFSLSGDLATLDKGDGRVLVVMGIEGVPTDFYYVENPKSNRVDAELSVEEWDYSVRDWAATARKSGLDVRSGAVEMGTLNVWRTGEAIDKSLIKEGCTRWVLLGTRGSSLLKKATIDRMEGWLKGKTFVDVVAVVKDDGVLDVFKVLSEVEIPPELLVVTLYEAKLEEFFDGSFYINLNLGRARRVSADTLKAEV